MQGERCTRSRRTPSFPAPDTLCLGLPMVGRSIGRGMSSAESQAPTLSPPSPQLRTKQDPFPFLSPRFQGNLNLTAGSAWGGDHG